jgi:hypothetical protein
MERFPDGGVREEERRSGRTTYHDHHPRCQSLYQMTPFLDHPIEVQQMIG